MQFVQPLSILQASSLADDLPVVSESYAVILHGKANRLLLTKETLDFCKALPIYKTEHTKMDPANETASK